MQKEERKQLVGRKEMALLWTFSEIFRLTETTLLFMVDNITLVLVQWKPIHNEIK